MLVVDVGHLRKHGLFPGLLLRYVGMFNDFLRCPGEQRQIVAFRKHLSLLSTAAPAAGKRLTELDGGVTVFAAGPRLALYHTLMIVNA